MLCSHIPEDLEGIYNAVETSNLALQRLFSTVITHGHLLFTFLSYTNSPSIIRVIKSKGLTWPRRVA